ncbi:hypothetical protein [Streptomyces sp. NPDC017529]|uniref:hypothetical protein n=1 Tax=Streptomyces sp. NPDC017529 TaxID=3365000 RepID=UPI00379758EB
MAATIPTARPADTFALPVAGVASALLVLGLMLGGGRAHPALSAAAFAALAAAVAALSRPGKALAAAVVCRLFLDGFLVNRGGDLAWHAADRVSLTVVLLSGLAGATATACARAFRPGPLPSAARWVPRRHAVSCRTGPAPAIGCPGGAPQATATPASRTAPPAERQPTP